MPGSPHDFPDSVTDQEEDGDQDSYDQDMDYMQGDSDSEDETLDRGQVVVEICRRWGWTLQDVLETLEQPGLSSRDCRWAQTLAPGGPSEPVPRMSNMGESDTWLGNEC